MPAVGGSPSNRSNPWTIAAGPNLPVIGGGTLGRLTKWTGFTSSNSFIGDSTIFESKTGLVGLGTDSPTSKLSVAGTIESLSGGFKFPDGTVQTTAGIAPNQVVRSLNGLIGDLTLVPGANITITPGASSLTIAATGFLGAVSHDATLAGDGTIGSPLGVAVPLILNGDSTESPVIKAVNSSGTGIQGESTSTFNETAGVHGINNTLTPEFGDLGIGVLGEAEFGVGVVGRSPNGTGVVGVTDDFPAPGILIASTGVIGAARSGTGVIGQSDSGTGVMGASFTGLAGFFEGNVNISGNLAVTGVKNFKIDHPLDPENKYLYHAAVESSEVLNVYSGNVTTDVNGDAVVELPAWFEVLNKDLRYQLTVIGTFAQAIVAGEVQNNRFTIATNAPNVKVSWQVTGVRSDAAMRRHPFKVEQEKQERERGTYLNPEAYGQPEERGTEWVRYPELMRQMKQRRIEAEQKHKPNNR
jgi:hypothetical protein